MDDGEKAAGERCLAERARDLSIRMVEWASVTGTEGEAAFTGKLLEVLRQIPYFKENPGHIAVLPSHGNPLCHSLVLLVRGSGRDALALAGHYDVVETANYLDLEHLAFRPEALAGALKVDLRKRAQRSVAEERALRDLETGDFLPGRGLLDMKSGLAAGIVALEAFAQKPDRAGNLLLFLTPDEERNSRGMRSLRDQLPALMRRWDLEIKAAVNLDSVSDTGDGSEGRAIFHGSVGKLMPFAFVLGQATHAGYPFEGIPAHQLAAEILTAIDSNTDLCDQGAGEWAPPPVCLEARDIRKGYEVTTPDRVWLAFNWLTHSMSAADAFTLFGQTVEVAANAALARFKRKADLFATLSGSDAPQVPGGVEIIRYSTFLDRALKRGGKEAAETLERLQKVEGASDNPLERSRTLINAMLPFAGIGAPAVVIGFSSLHYPAVHLDKSAAKDRHLLSAVDRARAVVEPRYGLTIKDKGYFAGISDMSYLGQAPAGEAYAVLSAETVLPDMIDHPPADALQYPAVNIGPWGREYHQKLERVHMPYAFQVLPDFLIEIVDAFFASQSV